MSKQKDLEDAFGSTPLKEALEEEPLEEFDTEEIELAGIGFNLAYVDEYKRRSEKDTVMYQGYPTNDFLDFYLENSNQEMLDLLKEHPKSFRDKQNEKINSFEVVEVVKKPEDDTFAGYIQKNSELMRENRELKESRDNWEELAKGVDDYIQLSKRLIEIFIEQGIKTNKLTKEDVELIKELNKQ